MTEFAPQLKLLAHKSHILNFVKGNLVAAPVQVEISPTNACPARCGWCFYVSSEYKQKHSQEELPFNVLDRVLNDMADMKVKAVTWTGGGDPCVYSSIDNTIDHAHYLGLRQGMFTNAYRAISSPEKLDWIRITITEKFTLTKHVRTYAEKTKVGVNFNLCSDNQEHMESMAIQARDMGVSYFQVRPALADRHDLQKSVEFPIWLKELETPEFRIVLTDYKWDDYLKPHGYPVCHGHRFVPFIWHNGDVGVCAYHFGKEPYTLGNVSEMGFREVWEGNQRLAMLQNGISVIHDCQHCCKLHEINKQLSVMSGDIVPADDMEFL